MVVGEKRAAIAPGRTAKIAIALNPRGQGLRKRFRKLPVSLTLRLTANRMTTVAVTRKLTIPRPK